MSAATTAEIRDGGELWPMGRLRSKGATLFARRHGGLPHCHTSWTVNANVCSRMRCRVHVVIRNAICPESSDREIPPLESAQPREAGKNASRAACFRCRQCGWRGWTDAPPDSSTTTRRIFLASGFTLAPSGRIEQGRPRRRRPSRPGSGMPPTRTVCDFLIAAQASCVAAHRIRSRRRPRGHGRRLVRQPNCCSASGDPPAAGAGLEDEAPTSTAAPLASPDGRQRCRSEA